MEKGGLITLIRKPVSFYEENIVGFGAVAFAVFRVFAKRFLQPSFRRRAQPDAATRAVRRRIFRYSLS